MIDINLKIEKCNEFNKNLHMAFINYEKAFDTVEMWTILNSMAKCRIDSKYTKLIENIYLHICYNAYPPMGISIRRGVRQGDTISPKLFISSLENIFREINWSGKGININREYLNYLRFADDILLIR